MVNKGDPDNIAVARSWILKQGTDEFILKNTASLDAIRAAFRTGTDSGPLYSFGGGDHKVPITFNADADMSANWVNMNARDLDGFLFELPFTLELSTKAGAPTGSGATGTIAESGGVLGSPTITAPGTSFSSAKVTLSGGSPSRAGKVVAIVSGGAIVKLITIDEGKGYSSSPTLTIAPVGNPIIFGFDAVIGDVSIGQDTPEGQVEISATLTITNDAVSVS